jgi:predicted DCC family thiol-disulfide oxidoreductase YuxK
MELNNKHIVFFDGECNFCNFWVKQVLKNERESNIYFSSLNSSFSKKTLNQLKVDLKNTDSIIVLYQGKIHTKSDAITLILKQLKLPFPFFATITSVLPSFFTDFFYDIIAKYRLKVFGKSESCDYSLFHEKNRMLE